MSLFVLAGSFSKSRCPGRRLRFVLFLFVSSHPVALVTSSSEFFLLDRFDPEKTSASAFSVMELGASSLAAVVRSFSLYAYHRIFRILSSVEECQRECSLERYSKFSRNGSGIWAKTGLRVSRSVMRLRMVLIFCFLLFLVW